MEDIALNNFNFPSKLMILDWNQPSKKNELNGDENNFNFKKKYFRKILYFRNYEFKNELSVAAYSIFLRILMLTLSIFVGNCWKKNEKLIKNLCHFMEKFSSKLHLAGPEIEITKVNHTYKARSHFTIFHLF